MSNANEIAARTRTLVDVAMGRTPADLVIRGGQWVSVQSGEIVPNTDIAVKGERIAYIGPDAGHTIGPQTQVIEAQGKFLAPGLLDAHMHVESGMLTVTEFVRAVLPHGTTGMFVDPHEIANVCGLDGVRLVVDEARQQPVHVWVQVPSCVPSAPGLETSGAVIGSEEVAEAMRWEGIVGLGEMMNFPGVYTSDVQMHTEMGETRAAGKVIGGHYASPDLGKMFHAYAAGGAEDDHEGTRLEDAIARVRQGMKAMLRLGSAWHDVAEQIKAVTEKKLDARYFILCTDDSHSETLVRDGHVNRAVKEAINCGCDPVVALQMATINTAEHFGMAKEVGLLAPGRYADILFLGDLQTLSIERVIARGKTAVENGKLMLDLPAYPYPDWIKNTVKIGRTMRAEDFRLDAGMADAGSVTAHVIGVIENQAPTQHLRIEVDVRDGEICAADVAEKGLAKVALVERHQENGTVQVGLVSGFGFSERCAIASTVAHDSHHMILVGTDEENMARAANELVRMGGGQVVVKDGQVIGGVELPIAGLISNERAEVVAEKAATVLTGFKACGCQLNNPNMQLSLLALVVIPELRLSNLGLVDVTNFKFIPVLENPHR